MMGGKQTDGLLNSRIAGGARCLANARQGSKSSANKAPGGDFYGCRKAWDGTGRLIV